MRNTSGFDEPGVVPVRIDVTDPASIAEAEKLAIERTVMGKMVGFLERDGFVTIKPSPKDGRSRLIELAEEGRRLHERAAPLWREAQREFEQLNVTAPAHRAAARLSWIVVVWALR
ncbi:hypothetical protein ACN8ZM_28555 [Burkholderia aenigmatica]|uniref:hypothetical protein n=1 Tax=Burkholderia aenigmatica TaxID=2015348 RepID=UPI003B42D4F4